MIKIIPDSSIQVGICLLHQRLQVYQNATLLVINFEHMRTFGEFRLPAYGHVDYHHGQHRVSVFKGFQAAAC